MTTCRMRRAMTGLVLLLMTGMAAAETNMSANVEKRFFKGKVVQVVDTGILANGYVMTGPEWHEFQKDLSATDAVLKENAATEKAGAEGRRRKSAVTADEQSRNTTKILGAMQYWEQWIDTHKRTYLIVGTPSNLVDGDKWSGLVAETGTHQYVNTMGAKATVRKYTVYKGD